MRAIVRNIRLRVIAMLVTLVPLSGYAVEPGQKTPDFAVEHLRDGSLISLDQYKGRVVYLDFWASWCVPCLKSFPFMEALQKQYGEKGLVVLAISLDESRDDAVAFLQKTQSSFVVGHNSSGDIATKYNVQAMPSSYLIGRDGTIQQRFFGFRTKDKEKLRKNIADSL